MLRRIAGRIQKPILEALKTASSTLRLMLDVRHSGTCGKRAYPRKPGIVVIVSVDNLQAEREGIARTLSLADEVFLLRKYVRIAIIYRRTDAAVQKTLDDC